MGPYGGKKFKTLLLLQLQLKVSKVVLNFLLNGLQKTTVGIFEILKIEINLMIFFFVFFNMGPYVGQNFKTLLLPQITF